jgi:hypothetical protein
MSTSLREQIVRNTETILRERADPGFRLVTREPFEVTELAITQFPAVLINFLSETRTSVSMGVPGVGRRTGTIVLDIRGFVRGNEIDRLRNDLVSAVEDALDQDRYLDLRADGVLDSQVTEITTEPRMHPLGEVRIRFEINYNYLRGTQA